MDSSDSNKCVDDYLCELAQVFADYMATQGVILTIQHITSDIRWQMNRRPNAGRAGASYRKSPATGKLPGG